MEYNDIIKKFGSMANPVAVEGMKKYGIDTTKAYGISVPNLRKIAGEIGVNHGIAQQLWASGIHEARILAGLVDDYRMVTEAQMERWVKDFDSWDVCDQCCSNLFDKTTFAYRKAVEWSNREEEFVKRAGFVLMAALAVHDKKAGDENFLAFLPVIKNEAHDDRNFVKKAMNWALRQIGKRNLALNNRAVETAREIQKKDSKSARWVASDAIRELTSQAVQKRLKSKKG